MKKFNQLFHNKEMIKFFMRERSGWGVYQN
jgi:hypothetical protein